MEQVERKLASLTGLVQTALTSAVGVHVQLSDNDLDSDTNSSGLPLRIPPVEPGKGYELYLLPFGFSLHFEMLLLPHLSSRPRQQPKEFILFFLDSSSHWFCFKLLKENCVLFLA